MFLEEHCFYDKRWMYEEALKMPLVARYPKEIKAAATNDDIVTNADFAETFLDYAGVGSKLISKDLVAVEDFAGITQKVAQVIEIIRDARKDCFPSA